MKGSLYSCLLSVHLPSGSSMLNWHLEAIDSGSELWPSDHQPLEVGCLIRIWKPSIAVVNCDYWTISAHPSHYVLNVLITLLPSLSTCHRNFGRVRPEVLSVSRESIWQLKLLGLICCLPFQPLDFHNTIAQYVSCLRGLYYISCLMWSLSVKFDPFTQ